MKNKKKQTTSVAISRPRLRHIGLAADRTPIRNSPQGVSNRKGEAAVSVRKFRQYLFCNLQKLQQKKTPCLVIYNFFVCSFLLSAASDWPGLTSIDPDSLRGTVPPIAHAHRRTHIFAIDQWRSHTFELPKAASAVLLARRRFSTSTRQRPHMKESVVFEGPRDQVTPPDCHIQRAFCLLLPKNPKKCRSKNRREKQAAKSRCCCDLDAVESQRSTGITAPRQEQVEMDCGTSLGGGVKGRPECWRPVFMWPAWLSGKQSQPPRRNHLFSFPIAA